MAIVNSSKRTANYLRQVKGAAGYRIVATCVSFITLPVLIYYLGQEKFGIWTTLLSVLSWIVFLDLGIGNSLRNKVAETLINGEETKASQFIGAGYALVGLIALTVWCLLVISSYFINWQNFFNTTAISESSLRNVVQLSISFVLVNLCLGLISSLFSAVQMISITVLGQLFTNLILLGLVLFLSINSTESINNLALVYGISLVLPNIFMSLFFFKKYPHLSLKINFQKIYARSLLRVGAQFFIIQLAVLVITTTDRLLIIQFFGPEDVTLYEIVFKLFSVVIIVHGFISAPLWSAYTDAYQNKEIDWIRNMLHKQLLMFIGFLLVIAILMTFASLIIKTWIGENIRIPFQLIIAMGIFVAISIWNNIFAIFINGIGKIHVQFYTALIAMLVNIPVSIYLIRNTDLGISAVIAGACFSLALAAFVLPVQVHRLLRN